MGSLAEIFVGLCGVCEAEGRALRRGALLGTRLAGLLACAIAFLGAGLAFLLAGLYCLLSRFLPDWLTWSCLGCASLAVAAGLFLLAADPSRRLPLRQPAREAQGGGAAEAESEQEKAMRQKGEGSVDAGNP